MHREGKHRIFWRLQNLSFMVVPEAALHQSLHHRSCQSKTNVEGRISNAEKSPAWSQAVVLVPGTYALYDRDRSRFKTRLCHRQRWYLVLAAVAAPGKST